MDKINWLLSKLRLVRGPEKTLVADVWTGQMEAIATIEAIAHERSLVHAINIRRSEIEHAREVVSTLKQTERLVLVAVANGPIMEADIGMAGAEVSTLVNNLLLQWGPRGCDYTDLGRDAANLITFGAVP